MKMEIVHVQVPLLLKEGNVHNLKIHVDQINLKYKQIMEEEKIVKYLVNAYLDLIE